SRPGNASGPESANCVIRQLRPADVLAYRTQYPVPSTLKRECAAHHLDRQGGADQTVDACM
ncbi:hypothetical protein, partial [uncultured Mycobacterium sp.]|uniref:hypothetical protein n=1 Tax=uncultured Mycobacterium sp. TaxID=171292 RepID=UPI0035CBDDA1